MTADTKNQQINWKKAYHASQKDGIFRSDSNGGETMARKSNVAPFKTASGSLACRKILADFLQSIA